MRLVLFCLALLSTPALAEEHHHLAEAGGLRVLHAWTAATTGREADVFLRIENRGDEEAMLTGASVAEAGRVEIVGFGFQDGAEVWTRLPSLPIPAKIMIELEPHSLALRLKDIGEPLEAGQHLEMVLEFGAMRLPVEVEVGPAGATSHSHAGHDH
ncbi:MAG: copper chaperone PCu(A)C [Cereibacter changlensis]